MSQCVDCLSGCFCDCSFNVKTAILPALDQVRILMDQLGLRKYDVFMRLTHWSGDQIGDEDMTIQDIPIQLGGPDGYGVGGTHRVLVRILDKTSQEIVASHGLYRAGDFMVGPLTPQYVACPESDGYGGVAFDYFDPQVYDSPTTIKFNISGDGMPPGGSWFKKIDQNVSRNFEYYFVLRQDATIDGGLGG